MKINEQYDVESTFQKTQNFKIEASSKAFQILSSNIYKNPQRAILRELVSNAWDAHVLKGNTDVPCEITMPNSLKPELVIKDFGVGLSPQAITTLYTVYFGSDKTWTDELIGGFGLGSKTPFSYTDQFSVVSRWNGKIYEFLCYYDDHGQPAVTQLDEYGKVNPDPEDTGLTITIPAKGGDTFARELDVLQYFPTLPIVHGSSIPVTDPMFKGTNFHVKHGSHYGNEATIVMGNVPYACTLGSWRTSRNPHEVPYSHFVLFVDIGEFEPAASRETLTKMDDAKVKALVHEACEEYSENIAKVLDKPNLQNWEVLNLVEQHGKMLNRHDKLKEVKADLEKAQETLKDLGDGFELRRYHSNNVLKRIFYHQHNYRCIISAVIETLSNPTREVYCIWMPFNKPKVPHVKMVREHFSNLGSSYGRGYGAGSSDKLVLTYQTHPNNKKKAMKALMSLIPASCFSDYTDWPVYRAKPQASSTTSSGPTTTLTPNRVMSAAYQDLFISTELGDQCTHDVSREDLHYNQAIKLDPKDGYILFYRRNYIHNNWYHDLHRALMYLHKKKHILYIPETELLKGRFRNLGFMDAADLRRKDKHILPFDYEAMFRITRRNPLNRMFNYLTTQKRLRQSNRYLYNLWCQWVHYEKLNVISQYWNEECIKKPFPLAEAKVFLKRVYIAHAKYDPVSLLTIDPYNHVRYCDESWTHNK
jgi:hypothetical protein